MDLIIHTTACTQAHTHVHVHRQTHTSPLPYPTSSLPHSASSLWLWLILIVSSRLWGCTHTHTRTCLCVSMTVLAPTPVSKPTKAKAWKLLVVCRCIHMWQDMRDRVSKKMMERFKKSLFFLWMSACICNSLLINTADVCWGTANRSVRRWPSYSSLHLPLFLYRKWRLKSSALSDRHYRRTWRRPSGASLIFRLP